MPALSSVSLVAPFAGAWIEICEGKHTITSCAVAPFAGAWIEIALSASIAAASVSLPSRERGLKSYAPYIQPHGIPVAPFAGAWIEISVSFGDTNALPSLPSRERGLKFVG